MNRLFYSPGLLSLALLLPLCTGYLYRQGVWKQERCMTVTFPVPPQAEPYPYLIEIGPSPQRSRTSWTELACTDNARSAAVLEAFRDSLRDMESREDTLHGIHLHFEAGTRYAVVISAIDICRTTVMAYELDGHDLWAVHYNEPRPALKTERQEPPMIGCGTHLLRCIAPEQPTRADRVSAAFSGAWSSIVRPYWMTWALAVVLGVLGIRRARRVGLRTVTALR